MPPRSCSGRAPRRRRWRIFREQMGLTCRIHERRLRVLPARDAGRSRRRCTERPLGRRHGAGSAAQHAAARRLGDRAGGGDRHPDRLLRGDPAGQPARPGAGDHQRRLRRDAELRRGDPAALFLLGAARLVPGARRRRCRQSPRPAAPSGAADRRARARLDRLHRTAGALLAARGAGRAVHPHRPRLWPAGTPRRHEIRAEARLHPDRRHPRRRHRRADGRRGVRRDHLQPAGPGLADLRRDPQPQLSDRPGRHAGRRRHLRRSPTCWSTCPTPGSTRASAKISAAPAPGAAPDAATSSAASGAARAAGSG